MGHGRYAEISRTGGIPSCYRNKWTPWCNLSLRNTHISMFVTIFNSERMSTHPQTKQLQTLAFSVWCNNLGQWAYPTCSMGMVYLPTWMVDSYGKCIGRYSIHGAYGTIWGDFDPAQSMVAQKNAQGNGSSTWIPMQNLSTPILSSLSRANDPEKKNRLNGLFSLLNVM